VFTKERLMDYGVWQCDVLLCGDCSQTDVEMITSPQFTYILSCWELCGWHIKACTLQRN